MHGALARARERGAATVFLACVPFEAAPDAADVSIRVVTGPEVLAGSTRLKAGDGDEARAEPRHARSRWSRLGKVHGNRMVDVDTRANAKLLARAGSGSSRPDGPRPTTRAGALLDRAEGA